MRVLDLLTIFTLTLALVGCKAQESGGLPTESREGVTITDARLALPPITGNPAAAYFAVHNDTDQALKIGSIDVAGAGMAMMHETLDLGGRSTMQPLANPVVPAHGTLEFAPGARHVMVTGIKPVLKAGTMTTLTLNFDDGLKAGAELLVVPPGAAKTPAGCKRIIGRWHIKEPSMDEIREMIEHYRRCLSIIGSPNW